MTLANLARQRYITRQHAWKMIQDISKAGFVRDKPNPSHKRSMLVNLTHDGRDYIEQHDARVTAFLTDLLAGKVSDEEVADTITLARKLRTLFDNWILQHDVEADKQLDMV